MLSKFIFTKSGKIFILLIILFAINNIICSIFGLNIKALLYKPKIRKGPVVYTRSLDHNCATSNSNVPESMMHLVPGINFKLYIICHDDFSCAIARKWSKCMPWTKLVRIESSVFFESLAYQSVFPDVQHEWANLDFVGVSTYKSLKFLPLEKLVAYLELGHCKQYDVVPLYGSGEFIMRQAVLGHGSHFQFVWDATLRSLGYSDESIRAQDQAEVFFRNTFLITPLWMGRLTAFMNQSMSAVLHSPALNAMLSTDANYREGKLHVARSIFGSDFYHWHPFIFERLPSFFLHHSEAKVFQTLRQVSLFENSEEHVELLYKGL